MNDTLGPDTKADVCAYVEGHEWCAGEAQNALVFDSGALAVEVVLDRNAETYDFTRGVSGSSEWEIRAISTADDGEITVWLRESLTGILRTPW